MKANIKPAFMFQFWDLCKSCAGFFLTIVALMLVLPLLVSIVDDTPSVSLSGYGVIATIFMFVVGIVGPRSYIRLDIQMGVSRRTTMLAQLLALLAVSVLLSVAGELLMALIQRIWPNDESHYFVDLYQMLYRSELRMTFVSHILSSGLNLCMMLCGYICGMFFTILFWRLNKLWTIVAVIALVALVNLSGSAVIWLYRFPWAHTIFSGYADAVTSGPAALMLTFLAIAVVAAVIDWLMLRRAFIRGSK